MRRETWCDAPYIPTYQSVANSRPSDFRELFGDLGFTDAGGAGEEVTADWFFGVAQTQRGQV